MRSEVLCISVLSDGGQDGGALEQERGTADSDHEQTQIAFVPILLICSIDFERACLSA